MMTKADGCLKKNTRRLMTGFCFLVFGLGSLDLGLIILPLIILTTANAELRRIRIQKTISGHFRLFLRLLQTLGLMRLDIQGLEKLKDDKGVIVIANHPTLIDVVVMMAFLPPVDCVVKEGLNHNLFLRAVVRFAGYITNSSPEQLMNACSERLNQGRNLIVFPEGTRTVPGQKLRFQRGVSHIALQTDCPIRPVYLKCEPITLSKQQKWYDIPDKPFVFSMQVGELLNSATYVQIEKTTGVQCRQFTRQLEQHYIQALTAF